MLTRRPARERGHAHHGWLDTWHTFSFAEYHDPRHMGFRILRVMNEDRVAPGQGFGTHPHRDMEIVTYVLSGALAHKDSLGHAATLRPGEFQRITAGTGVLHSEFNPSPNEPAHFYQIWLLPEARGATPSYEQKTIAEAERQGRLRIVASPDGREGSLTIGQNALIWLATLTLGDRASYRLAPERHAWLQVLRGAVRLNDVELATSDGAAVSDEAMLTIEAAQDAEVMLFDLP